MEPADERRLMILAEQNRADIKDILAEQKLHREIVIGNGKSESSVMARLQRLETRSSTLSFFVDKVVAPVVASIVTAGLILALS
jgi:hypothetical protein